MTSRSVPALLVLAALVLVPVAAARKLQIQHTAITRPRAVKSNYHWTISNYSSYKFKKGDSFESPVLSTYDEGVSLNWTVLVYPRGSANETDDSFGVFLVYDAGDLDVVRVRYSIHLLDEDDEDFRSADGEDVLQRGDGASQERLASAAEVTDPANRVLKDDELRVFVEFAAFVGDRSVSEDCRGAGGPPYLAHLEPYLGSFEYSDLTISAENMEFRAHKLLVASRSRVFDEIFKNYGIGRAMLKFTMEDFSAQAVAEALRYMYTGKIGKLSPVLATEVLTLTLKYSIEGLKDLIMEELCLAHLNVDPEKRMRAMQEIETDAIRNARRLSDDAQKACSIVPIDLSKIYEIESVNS